MALLRKQPVDDIATAEMKVANIVQQIADAKSAFEQAEANATAAALSGDGLDEAVSVAAQASAKLKAFERAKVQADEKVIALRAAKVAADNAARRDEATAKVEAWRTELVALKAKLAVINTASDLAGVQDRVGRGVAPYLISPNMEGHANTLLELVGQTVASFDNQLRILRLGDDSADELATKVLQVSADFDAKIRRAA